MEVWSGIDVSKAHFDASWVDSEAGIEDFQRIPHAQFQHSPAGVRQYLRWLREHRASLDPDDRACVDAVLAGSGCEHLFA